MRHNAFLLCLVLAIHIFTPAPIRAESHRATHLGYPATRFAAPLATPDDLRARFGDSNLQSDIAIVLEQWGWQGNTNDLFTAAATAEIEDTRIPVGAIMPFMSSRKSGRPICLRNVTWAGKEPAPAYAFNFTSNGRRHRCVTPKACSNFYLEDLGPEPKPVLAMDCAAPAEIPVGRPLGVCLTIQNTGNASEAKIEVNLAIPQGVILAHTTEGGALVNGTLTWEISNLAPNSARQVCATLGMREPGSLPFNATAKGSSGQWMSSACATKIIGVPAILFEVVDLEDPIEVGQEVTYDIKVTNQGSATGTNIRVAATLADSQEFVSGSGASAVQADGKHLLMENLAVLAAKAEASWRVVVKATRAADARFKVELTSDQFPVPITEFESTEQY